MPTHLPCPNNPSAAAVAITAEECQAGCILAQSIMAQQEELDLRQRQAADQQRWQQQAEESESEEESEEEEEELADGKGVAQRQVQQQQQEKAQQAQQAAAAGGGPQGPQGGAPPASGQPGGDGAGPAAAAEQGEGEAAAEVGPSYIHISEAEAQENAAAFLDAMRQRFLAGQDAGVDYAAIDAGGWGQRVGFVGGTGVAKAPCQGNCQMCGAALDCCPPSCSG